VEVIVRLGYATPSITNSPVAEVTVPDGAVSVAVVWTTVPYAAVWSTPVNEIAAPTICRAMATVNEIVFDPLGGLTRTKSSVTPAMADPKRVIACPA
jgi:hypothetical protein